MTTVNPSTNVAALQGQIRQYVEILSLLKKKRTEVKTMNDSLKELSEDILDGMVEQNIPSCASSGHFFTVKEKCKMKSATAKSFLVQVKEFFNLKDEDMDEFMILADKKRKAEGEVINTLECKSVKKSADQRAGDDASDDIFSGHSPSMSSAADSLYS